MAAQHNPEFCKVLNHADLCVADGVGLLWAARRLGRVLPERVTGSDLVPLLARKAAESGWRIYLLGAGPGVAERTAQILLSRNSGSSHSRRLCRLSGRGGCAGTGRANTAGSTGHPVGGVWRACAGPVDCPLRQRAGVPVMIGVGGAFDHIAGVRKRAPGWIQRIHLEWLFRLITQPWRWRRQLALPRFVWAVMRQARQNKKSQPKRQLPAARTLLGRK